MSATAVVGLQWGDEAKGKIVHLLTEEHDVVVRYQGGNNAGHTVVFGGQTYKLSLLPAGILNPKVTSVIANGVVINPKALLKEIDEIAGRNGTIGGEQLRISDRAHVIFPYHMLEEVALERSRKDDAIGTTMRGIGTCYRDKAGRTHAIRIGDLYRTGTFRGRLAGIVEQKNAILGCLDPDVERLSADAVFDEYSGYAERLRPYVTDTTAYLQQAIQSGKRLLFEGAQGALLDIDHGTFPFVTSSNSSSCGISTGSGVPARVIDRMLGVVKAYTTRVGGGPFPTELKDATGNHIREIGREYGTVTGRPRRCGWFDAVAAGYSARICGVTGLSVMLLDVLSQLDELKVCEAYEIDGERTSIFPSHVEDLAKAKPVYRTLPGWKKDISTVRKVTDFPQEARRYIDTIGELLGTRVEIMSVGPDREQTILA